MEQDAKLLCLQRDANRCRHCGGPDNLNAFALTSRKGVLREHLSNLITLCDSCVSRSEHIREHFVPNRVGVILCGGRGTRLYPITRITNKHLLPIGVLPTVFYPLKTLRYLGVKKVLIVVDREGTGEMLEVMGSGAEFGMDITYKVQEGAGGISEALYLARNFAHPGDEIVCILGDNIFDRSSLEQFNGLGGHRACVWLKEVENPTSYGVATIQDERVVKIVEKPAQPETNLAVVGLYAYDYDVFNVIDNIEPSGRGELEISTVNHYYAERKQLMYQKVKGYWGDMGGSPGRYAECAIHGAKEANISYHEALNAVSVVFDNK